MKEKIRQLFIERADEVVSYPHGDRLTIPAELASTLGLPVPDNSGADVQIWRGR